jgi:hypothetical protein
MICVQLTKAGSVSAGKVEEFERAEEVSAPRLIQQGNTITRNQD